MRVRLFLFSTLFSLPIFGASNWSVNDVSILFDLPTESETLSFLIGAGKGPDQNSELIPSSVHDQIKPLILGAIDQPKNEYEALRVVAARLDPCFKYATSEKCFPQLRLVWQPVGKSSQGGLTSFDAGLHSFYELSPVQWTSLLQKMNALKIKMEKTGVKTGNVPLNIHPALKNPATRSAFMSEMKSIIFEFCGKKNLSRVTFMRLFTPDIWWVFGGFERKNNEWSKMKLPRMEEKESVQNFFNDDFNAPMGIKGSITPALDNPSEADDLTKLLKDYSYTFSTPEGQTYAKKSLVTLDRIENPSHFTPETMDCIHCHMAQATRAWFYNKEKSFYIKNQQTPFKYSGSNLKNTSLNGNNPKSLRIFGYFGKTTAIGQRVINESAEVAKVLNRAK